MSEWKIVNIGDYISFQNGYAFNSKTFSSNGKYLVVRIKEIKNGFIKFFPDSAKVDVENEFAFNKYKVEEGDILFALTGDPVSRNNHLSWVGRIAIYNHKKTALLNQRVCKVIFGEDIYPLFFYYYFRLEENLFDLARRATGSANQANISTNTISKMQIKLPPLETQKKISAVLSALDDKIELNNAINKNLEEQAQAIYKNMFVDNFNPAWKNGTLSDIAEITNGKRPLNKFEKASEFVSIPIFGASSIMGYTTDILCDKKILITGRVGTHGIIQRYNKPCWVSDNAFIITSLYYEYCFQILRSVNYKNLNRGSTQPLITQTDLKKLDVILPSEKILLNFEELVGSLMRVCDKNHFENQKLGELRDALLPRLMSGEIDVSEVEILGGLKI